MQIFIRNRHIARTHGEYRMGKECTVFTVAKPAARTRDFDRERKVCKRHDTGNMTILTRRFLFLSILFLPLYSYAQCASDNYTIDKRPYYGGEGLPQNLRGIAVQLM